MRVPLGALRHKGVFVVPQLEHSWPAERSSSETVVLGQTSSGSVLTPGWGDGMDGMADMVQQRYWRSVRGSIGRRRGKKGVFDGVRELSVLADEVRRSWSEKRGAKSAR